MRRVEFVEKMREFVTSGSIGTLNDSPLSTRENIQTGNGTPLNFVWSVIGSSQ
jgi:hypothetical protein